MVAPKNVLFVPFLTLLMALAIILNIPIFRETIVFFYLSFVPGYVIIKLFQLRDISFLKVLLFSAGLSIAFSMLVGLILSGSYFIFGLSKPLSIIPVSTTVSILTLILFFVGYRRDLSVSPFSTDQKYNFREYVPILLVLIFLVAFSFVSAILINITLMLISCGLIAVLCVFSVSKKFVPTALYPFLVFSIGLALLCLSVFVTKYIIGFDSNIEFYIFKLTQINGYWNPNIVSYSAESALVLNYNSMLSINVLPNVYSVLMNVGNETVFKLLFLFSFSLVPVVLYELYQKQTGKSIAFLSVFFFIFTATAFFGEPVSLNRQIIGALFLLLFMYVLLDKTLPMAKRKLLMIFFGAALAISHYSLAYILLIFVVIIFVASKIKSRYENVIDITTVLLLFGITFAWYSFISISLNMLTGTIQRTLNILFSGGSAAGAGTAAGLFAVPTMFTTASWINLAVSGLANLFIVVGVIVIIFKSESVGISKEFRWIIIIAAAILGVSFAAPEVAAVLNFTRFYGITLLFLSPCFVIGGLALLETVKDALINIKGSSKNLFQFNFRKKKSFLILFLIATLACAYFLSQSGFVNYTTKGAIHSLTIDYEKMKEDRLTVPQFYSIYLQEQDIASATWLYKNTNITPTVYSDTIAGNHQMVSYGLLPNQKILPISNETKPAQGTFVYLDTMNMVYGVLPAPQGLLNTTDVFFAIEGNSLIYSNGNSAIWSATGLD